MRIPSQKWLDIFGMTADEYVRFREIHGVAPLHKFRSQVGGAARRGVPWRMTFPEWWRIWQQCGKYEERGRNRGQYSMQRRNDSGGYADGNVEINEVRQNVITKVIVQTARRGRFRRNSESSPDRELWQQYSMGRDPLEILMEQEGA